MNISEALESLRSKAFADPALRNALLATREHPDALAEFCRISTEAGLPIYEMDIIEYGEYAYAAMKRSTNGGGENSPLLDGEDDAYEMFLFELEQQNKQDIADRAGFSESWVLTTLFFEMEPMNFCRLGTSSVSDKFGIHGFQDMPTLLGTVNDL